jgi:plasmid stabilization system protein ParE
MAMKYRIEYISTFNDDVLHVATFLDEYPHKAARLFAKLDKMLSVLVKMPEMYPVYEDLPNFRYITIEDYLAFYTVNKHNRIIEVHRLLYGRMDLPNKLISPDPAADD